jgi:hypothetical protein
MRGRARDRRVDACRKRQNTHVKRRQNYRALETRRSVAALTVLCSGNVRWTHLTRPAEELGL